MSVPGAVSRVGLGAASVDNDGVKLFLRAGEKCIGMAVVLAETGQCPVSWIPCCADLRRICSWTCGDGATGEMALRLSGVRLPRRGWCV